MWLHVILFAATAGFAIACKKGWIRPGEADDEKGRRLAVIAALAGNFLGLLVTLGSGNGTVYTEGYTLPKEETGTYEQKFQVSVDGEDAGTLYVQVPEKESEEKEEETEETVTEEDAQEQKLRDAVALYNQERDDPDYFYLPAEWDGRQLAWQLPTDHSGYLLSCMGLVAAVAILAKKMQERREQQIKRSEQLLMDYPGLVMKFTLLIQAGMTAGRAFRKIALDYGKRTDGKKRYAYEEIKIACYEMDSGVSEAEVYYRFGERCGQVKYKIFATLLIQNLQKGSKNMVYIVYLV
jgi:tight adherence protein C